MTIATMLRGRPVHIVGCGSLGGKLFLNLYRKGVPLLHAWDADVVEERNLYNQPFFGEDVGRAKVAALERIARFIYPHADTVICLHGERVVPGTRLDGIVLMAVDGNRKRYNEVLPCLEGCEAVSFVADGRIGMDGGKAYGFDPSNPWHITCYKDPIHNHPDPDTIDGCKTEFPVPENSDRVASEMLWRLTRWLELESGCPDPYLNVLAWCYTPTYAEAHEYWDEPSMHEVVADT